MKIECSNCGKKNPIENKFCGECGTKLPPIENYCPDCNRTFTTGEKFCTECGRKLVNQETYEEEKKKRENDPSMKFYYNDIKKILKRSPVPADDLLNKIYDGPSNNVSPSSKIKYLLSKHSYYKITVMIDNAEQEIMDENYMVE